MDEYHSKFNIKEDEIKEARALLQKIINEKPLSCDPLIKATPNVQLVFLQSLIHSKESNDLAIRKSIVKDLVFCTLANDKILVSSSLAAQWLPIEPDGEVRYFLFLKLIYNVQQKDEPTFSLLENLINTNQYVCSQVINWLSRYPANRVLAGNIHKAITKQSRNLLKEKDSLLLIEVDKIMALPPEEYDTIQNERFLEDWQNKMDMGMI